jgi:hypothetical protein
MYRPWCGTASISRRWRRAAPAHARGCHRGQAKRRARRPAAVSRTATAYKLQRPDDGSSRSRTSSALEEAGGCSAPRFHLGSCWRPGVAAIHLGSCWRPGVAAIHLGSCWRPGVAAIHLGSCWRPGVAAIHLGSCWRPASLRCTSEAAGGPSPSAVRDRRGEGSSNHRISSKVPDHISAGIAPASMAASSAAVRPVSRVTRRSPGRGVRWEDGGAGSAHGFSTCSCVKSAVGSLSRGGCTKLRSTPGPTRLDMHPVPSATTPTTAARTQPVVSTRTNVRLRSSYVSCPANHGGTSSASIRISMAAAALFPARYNRARQRSPSVCAAPSANAAQLQGTSHVTSYNERASRTLRCSGRSCGCTHQRLGARDLLSIADGGPV